MTLALGLLVAAVVLGVGAPAVLCAVLTRVRPGLLLAGWVSSVVLMLATGFASALLFALPRGAGLDGFIGMADSCLNVVRGGEVVGEHLVRVGVAAVLFGLLGWTLLVAMSMLVRYRRWRREHLRLLRVVCRCEGSVLWIEGPDPVAYSVGGRGGAVVATSGVRRLSDRERSAVLAHEHAHLRGRHHALVLVADMVAKALPFVPLCRRAPGHLRVLVELAADAAAARRHGPDSVRAALLSVTSAGTPSAALAMSRDAVELRLAWLSDGRLGARGLPGRMGHVLATALALVATVMTIAAVVAVVAIYCVAVAEGSFF
ncbi:M56 family metallopeptidase [Saccharomonospora viridis]|uniref:M56 family metallopeptidase n=1 Tax=Saccharomonospora viridis TaxID=1852 RepID=UPI002409E678|nr:M56 family metallopeptidase [Saccharomonospora viridis]